MELSAEQPIKPPQSFPLNQQNNKINNNYGNPIIIQDPYTNENHQEAIIITQIQPQIVTVIRNVKFGTFPVSVTCQFCQIPITSVVKKRFNICSCLFCCWFGFVFWVCFQSIRGKEINCFDAEHSCPNCGQKLGNYYSC